MNLLYQNVLFHLCKMYSWFVPRDKNISLNDILKCRYFCFETIVFDKFYSQTSLFQKECHLLTI